jgi:hypothetical protein
MFSSCLFCLSLLSCPCCLATDCMVPTCCFFVASQTYDLVLEYLSWISTYCRVLAILSLSCLDIFNGSFLLSRLSYSILLLVSSFLITALGSRECTGDEWPAWPLSHLLVLVSEIFINIKWQKSQAPGRKGGAVKPNNLLRKSTEVGTGIEKYVDFNQTSDDGHVNPMSKRILCSFIPVSDWTRYRLFRLF